MGPHRHRQDHHGCWPPAPLCATAPERIALITTDSYRIGAQDQLRLYGKILGVSVFRCKTRQIWHVTLADLADKHLVLIDSTGMGQRDARVDAQTQMYGPHRRQWRPPDFRVLVLAANAEGATLEDVVNCYLPGGGLVGCVMSKSTRRRPWRRHRHHHPSPFAIAVCDQWPARAGRSPPGQVQLPD